MIPISCPRSSSITFFIYNDSEGVIVWMGAVDVKSSPFVNEIESFDHHRNLSFSHVIV